MPEPQAGVGAQVLVFAPSGRDAEYAARLLGGQGIASSAVKSLPELAAGIAESTGAVLVTSEALVGRDLSPLLKVLDAQPSWSDLPFVCLSAARSAPLLKKEDAHRLLSERVSNVLVLERPLSSESLLSAMRSALRARSRQYKIRDQLGELARQAEELARGRDALQAADERREFLFSLALRQRALDTPRAAMEDAARALAQRLGADRVGFLDVLPDGAAAFGPSVGSDSLAPLDEAHCAGVHSLRLVRKLKLGRTLRFDDSRGDPLVGNGYFAQTGARSGIEVPLLRDGLWCGSLYVHQARPRAWSAEEIALAEEAAQISWDAVELVRSQAALRGSEAMFRAITNSIDQMIWSTRPDGHHDYYNGRWYEYTGVPRGSTDGQAWNGVFHPGDRERAWAVWRECLRTGRTYHIEYRLRHWSGEYRWVLGRAQPVRDAAGAITRWFGTCTDIQEIVDAREVLARSREDLELEVQRRTRERDRIWEASEDLLGVADAQGVWQSVNPAWTRLLGWREDEVVGRGLVWLLHPDDAQRTADEIARLAAGAATLAFENRMRMRDGEHRVLSWSVTAADGRLYCVGRDVSEQRRHLAALRLAEEQLRQAQKMEAVGQLTGGIAHDFNNLLQGITGSLAVARKRIDLGRTEDLGRFLDGALQAAFRAAGLTHRLLAFSRRQPLDPKRLEVNPLIESMAELLRRTLGEHIELELALAGGLRPTRCDANQLENAVLNLVINARDAMPDGGRLRVETGEVRGREAAAGLEDADYVYIAVTDDGTGMAPDVIARAFDPFFTTKPMGQGTGLGLSMIYGFARQSEGACRIDSELGRGTTVRLFLPVRDGAPEAVPDGRAAGAVAWTAPHSDAVVMVVEDDEVVRSLVVEALSELGLQVRAAADGPQGLEALRALPRVDLLVTDIGLPGLNGRQLADAARVQRPQLKVLFMTGYAETAVGAAGFLEPGMEMITKPFAVDIFAARVCEMVQGLRDGTAPPPAASPAAAGFPDPGAGAARGLLGA